MHHDRAYSADSHDGFPTKNEHPEMSGQHYCALRTARHAYRRGRRALLLFRRSSRAGGFRLDYRASCVTRKQLECTLHAVTAVDRSRNGGQTQISDSSGAEVGRPGRLPQLVPRAQGWEAGTTPQARAKNMHSTRNLRKLACRQRWRGKAETKRTKK
jgi:hypothetical protein